MATRAVNTMSEGLTGMLSTLAQMKLAPDANPEFIGAIETALVGFLRGPQDQAQQSLAQLAQSQGGGAMGAGAMPQQQPGGAGAPAPPMPPGGGGGPTMGGGPAGDELRRLIQTMPPGQ